MKIAWAAFLHGSIRAHLALACPRVFLYTLPHSCLSSDFKNIVGVIERFGRALEPFREDVIVSIECEHSSNPSVVNSHGNMGRAWELEDIWMGMKTFRVPFAILTAFGLVSYIQIPIEASACSKKKFERMALSFSRSLNDPERLRSCKIFSIYPVTLERDSADSKLRRRGNRMSSLPQTADISLFLHRNTSWNWTPPRTQFCLCRRQQDRFVTY